MYTKKYHNQKQNNREEELKKASRNKLLIPIENEDPVADPTTVREYDSSEEEFAVNDFDATDELIRSIHERTNQRHQDAVDAYANPFPLNYFPKKIREYLEDCERCLSTNIEYLAGGLLCAVSGAIGNKFNAELTRDKRNSACLYMVIVGPTGANKTLPLQTVLKPLFVIEKELAKKYEQEKQNSDELLIENRCIVNDCTMEAILEILENNDVTVYHDEFYGFLSSFNKYRGGDDMEKWLSIWSAAQMRTDRKNKKGKLIEKPFANCIGTIQQDVLVDFLTKNNTNNGFNERLLFITTKKMIVLNGVILRSAPS